MAVISYEEWSQKALYGPQGYYRAERPRVGRRSDTDFFTSSSVPLYPKLMAHALATLAQLHRLEDPILVEVGHEPGARLWPGVPKGFGGSVGLALGERLQLPQGAPLIVFSNELLDAQAWTRVRKETQGWVTLGLDVRQKIWDLTLGPAPQELQELLGEDWPTGATLDVSPRALQLVDELCRQDWQGLWVAADYGLSLVELKINPRPTARAYSQHRSLTLPEALELPEGSCDLTHHVVWDLVAKRLESHRFGVHPLATQEAFVVHYAGALLPQLGADERRQLATLIHPGQLGERFQVMVGARGSRGGQS